MKDKNDTIRQSNIEKEIKQKEYEREIKELIYLKINNLRKIEHQRWKNQK